MRLTVVDNDPGKRNLLLSARRTVHGIPSAFQTGLTHGERRRAQATSTS